MSGFRDNEPQQRYELDHLDGPSFARYREKDGVRAILHVETPSEARGQGHAAVLMEQIVSDARARGLKLIPVCGYAAAYLRRHAEAADVLA